MLLRPASIAVPILVLAAALHLSCKRGETPPAGKPSETLARKALPSRLPFEAIPADLADLFSGERAFDNARRLIELGPRPPGSTGYQNSLRLLEGQLGSHGWSTRRQSFIAQTPAGPVTFTNLLARFPAPGETALDWEQSRPAIVGGHLDSKLLDFPFVGANDGGSSTGILVEVARVLATDPEAAARFEIVFFDGEEAFGPNITSGDGLYGSKYFARSLTTRASWPALGIVLDIVGDPNHPLLFNPETPPAFATAVTRAAATLGFEKPLAKAPGPIIDDHIPLQNTGLPCLHLIGDFTAMEYWHQPGDTLDKITPGMLEKVGRLTLGFLSRVSIGAAE